jgi:DHA1 family quinolone resistance protein-like MFS transporter
LKSLIRTFQTISFVAGVSAGLILPVLFVYLRARVDSNLDLAILALTSTVTSIALQLPSGNIADAFGRKRTFMAGQVAFVIFCICITFSTSFTALVFSMLLSGLATSLVSGTLDAIFVQRYGQSGEQAPLQTQYAKQSAFALIGTLTGVLIGIALGSMAATGNGILQSAQDSIFLITALITVGLMVFVQVRVEEVRGEDAAATARGNLAEFRHTFSRSIAAFAGSKQLLAITSSSAIAAAGYMSFEKFWQLQVNELVHEPISRTVFYWFFCGALIVSMLGQQLSVRLCKYFEDNLVYPVIVSRFVLIVAFVCLYLSYNVMTFALAYGLVALATASSATPSMALFQKFVPAELRTSLLSIRSMLVQAGATLGIIQAGLISKYYSIDLAFLASAGLYVISTTVYYLNLVPRRTGRVMN